MDWNDLIAQQKPEKPKYTAKEKRGCIVLAVILLIVLLIAYKILHTPWMAATAFGAVFFLIGLRIARQTKADVKPQWRLPAALLIIGAVMLLTGLTALLSDGFGLRILPESEQFRHRFKSVAFILTGCGILAYMAAGLVHKKRWCRERVEALCTDLIRKRSRHTVYVPVYEYFSGGTTHQIRDSIAMNYANPKIGDTRVIYIDPQYHDEMLDPKRYFFFLLLPGVMALFLIGIGVWLWTV